MRCNCLDCPQARRQKRHRFFTILPVSTMMSGYVQGEEQLAQLACDLGNCNDSPAFCFHDFYCNETWRLQYRHDYAPITQSLGRSDRRRRHRCIGEHLSFPGEGRTTLASDCKRDKRSIYACFYLAADDYYRIFAPHFRGF